MYIKIWHEIEIPLDDRYTNISSMAIGPRYDDIESAVTALAELAENNFNFSKYRMKTVLDIIKVSDYEYVVLEEKNIKERFVIPTTRKRHQEPLGREGASDTP